MASTTKRVQRIVVRGTNWVGDAVMTIPALRALRSLFPNATITLATRPWAEGLFSAADFIDDLLIYDRGGIRSVARQISEWRNRRFDIAVLFQNAFEAALIAALARVPFRIGYDTQRRGVLLTHPLVLPEWHKSRHEVFYYLNIIAETANIFGGTSEAQPFQPDGSLRVSPQHQGEAKRLLQDNGLGDDTPIVAFCPGSINSRAKRWPIQHYAALGDNLVQQFGVKVVLIGSQSELEVSLEVSRLMDTEATILTGKTTLTELVAILSIVDLLITNDTGPAHIAAALGRPTLVLFGPTNPLTTRPFGSVAEIVRHPPDCAPCMLRDCPIDHRCMTAITPEEVLERARPVILGTKRASDSRQNRI